MLEWAGGGGVFGGISSHLATAVSYRGKVLLVDHEAHAPWCPTVARTLLEASQTQTIIVGQLFAGVDAAQGIDPDSIARDPRLAVGRTAVIEVTGRVPHHAAV